jgi:long-chain fatty acid transport protein
MVIETGFGIYLPNGDVQRATRRSTHSFVPWIVGLGGSYKLAQHTRNAWELTGTLGYERWSRYVNRQSDRPTRDYAWRDVPNAALGVRLTHDTRLTGLFDVNFRPSPVPRQTGRTNYVDNDRYGLSAGVHYELPFADWQIALRFGAQAQLHILPERRQTKLDPSAASTDSARSQRVLDEWPDDSVDVATGEPIAEARGLQTNNPGYPGFASRGLILGGGASISLLY